MLFANRSEIRKDLAEVLGTDQGQRPSGQRQFFMIQIDMSGRTAEIDRERFKNCQNNWNQKSHSNAGIYTRMMTKDFALEYIWLSLICPQM